MNTTITSNGLPALPQPQSGQSGTAQQNTASGSTAATPATSGGDSVKLTESARSLQDIARAGNGNEVDTKRVEQIRQSLANGSYRIDPGHIADRLVSLESQLTNKS